MNKLLRHFYSVYTLDNQRLLYTYGFFLTKWILHVLKENKLYLYYIPKSLIEIPFNVFKFLHKIKSPYLMDKNLRNGANGSNELFVNDDFFSELVYFYTLMFSDPTIANPEIKESLIAKINYLLKKDEINQIFEENKELFENLIRGLLNYMSVESYSHITCDILVKIIKPICFGQSQISDRFSGLIKATKTFFEKNEKVFLEFMDNYTKLVNKLMTEYSMSLSDSIQVIMKKNKNI